MKSTLLAISVLLLVSCNSHLDDSPLGITGEKLVLLTLQAGTLDEDLVDSYIGNLTIDTTETYSIGKLKTEFKTLISEINSIQAKSSELISRKNYQLALANATYMRLRVLNEEDIPFIDECKAIYQVTPTIHQYSYYDSLLSVLDTMIKGNGSLEERYSRYLAPFKIDYELVDKAFKTSIAKAAEITKKHIELPDSESVTIEYRNGAPWSAYNWYKGNYKSLIELNTNADIYLDRVFGIAAHESYPGHHVYYSLREKKYYREKGYVEFSIYPLFSPVSLLAEGTAEYANNLIFPEKEKIEFLKTKIKLNKEFSDEELSNYFHVLEIVDKLGEVVINVAEQFIDHKISPDEAIAILQKYGLESEKGAIRKLQFINQYRSYIINYYVGKQMIAKYITLRAGNDNNKQWEVYENILESPYLPNDLKKQLNSLTTN